MEWAISTLVCVFASYFPKRTKPRKHFIVICVPHQPTHPPHVHNKSVVLLNSNSCLANLSYQHMEWTTKQKWNIKLTCRCRCSNRNFSEFAISYSPFSRYLWSGLSLESVGGNFSCIHKEIQMNVSINNPKMQWKPNWYIYIYMKVCACLPVPM